MKHISFYILFLHSIVLSQFGQNILQYEKFDWQYIQTDYFDIYFYDIGLENRDFLKFESDQAYEKMSSYLDWSLKDRYTIILHNSHNDFQQTNVINMYMQEGIGGVTELYKNRVVIPFDGSLADLKHVLHHELVHLFINDMLYGGSVRNMIYSNVKPIPLWMNEGLAEYLSEKWNSNSEMWIRDIAANGGTLPNFNQLNGYLAYRGGHSVWRFMTEKWGDEIISQLLWEVKRSGSANKAFEKALGLDAEGLLELWHSYLKGLYWPDIKNRKNISQISETLINHKDLDNSYNIAPFISPTGEKFTIYSNKSGRMDIYLVSTNDGEFLRKVIDGEETSKFEELHILKPGVSWSNDGSRIVFAAKSGKSDALYILDLKTNKASEYRLDLEGIFQPVWNPLINSSEIAFIGNNGLQSDIYIYDFEKDDLLNLTNDWFSDTDPSWSGDGENLYFVSNRNDYNFTSSGLSFSSLDKSFDVTQNDIYKIKIKNRKIIRLTNTPWNESLPSELKDNKGIIFLSDESGINNLYVNDFVENFPITNIATGITQFSIDRENRQILFCGLEKGGFNIYSITDPLRLLKKDVVSVEADWLALDLSYDTYINQKDKKVSNKNNYNNNYSNFVFNRIDSSKISDFSITKDVKKEYNDTVYSYDKPRFTLDFMQAAFGYDLTYNNTQGMAQILLSDMMGDYRIYINTEMEVDFKNSDYMFEYHYLPNRIDWFFRIYHYAYLFDQNYNLFADYRIENMGINVLSKFPLNRFERFESSVNLNHTTETSFDEQNYFQEEYEGSSNIFQASLGYVWDNSKWGGLHPIDGSRFYTKYRFSPKHSDFNYDFHCLTLDFRKYNRFQISSLGMRFFAGKFWGNSPYKFKLGGAPWIASSENRPQYNYDSEEHYFSEYVYPIRGKSLGSMWGSNVLLMNLEYRLPMLLYYLPTIQWLGQINGVFFTDLGTVWNENIPDFNDSASWNHSTNGESVEGWAWTYGFGPRFVFLGMPWQLDYTWQYYPVTGKNQYNGWFLSMGLDF